MKRRYFITLIGGAVMVWPGRVNAQQRSMPLIGYLSGRSPAESARIVAAFRQGLKDAGFVEGQNVIIESRFADGDFDRLPTLTGELVRRGVDVLVAVGGNVTVIKARPVVPATIPIVFVMGGDPVRLGVVASLNKPGGNITGVSFLVNQLGVKEIELLHELVPNVSTIGFLVNPNNPSLELDMKGAKEAANAFGRRLVVVNASTEGEIERAFASLAQEHVKALFVHSDPFFVDHRQTIVSLAMRNELPTVSQLRDFAVAGALATYGTSIIDAKRQLGLYTAKVLRGTKPADLPVVLSTRFELTINLRTAKTLGLTFPPGLLAIADEVIE
jgi:putative ABC transport system substrate-binding protein